MDSPLNEKAMVNFEEGQEDGSVLATISEPIDIDPAMEARVRRKIDLVVLPIFGFIFMFQYLDKVNAESGLVFIALLIILS